MTRVGMDCGFRRNDGVGVEGEGMFWAQPHSGLRLSPQ